MYGLPQAGILANKLLKKRLAPHGYYELPHTPGLFKHISLPIQFTLVVDGFGVKYVGQQSVDHLINALRQDYEINTDWSGSLYCGITLNWNYEGLRYVDTSMPHYVEKQNQKYGHVKSKHRQDTPLQPAQRTYGKYTQKHTPPDESPRLDEAGQKYVQRVVGSYLYYRQAADPPILHAPSVLGSEQADATENTRKKATQFLDYMA